MEWIELNENNLPPKNEYVLVNTCEGVTIAEWDGRDRCWGIVSQPDEPLAYRFYNMQTELLELDNGDRASFSIKERVTHWMKIPDRPNIEYKKPREWNNEERQAWHKKQMDGLIAKYNPENNALFMEIMNKITIPEDYQNLKK